MKLADLPRSEDGIKIVSDGISDGSAYILFFHTDGMYSYCKTEKGGVIHLSVMTPLKKVGDHYEIDVSKEEAEETSDSDMWRAHRKEMRHHRAKVREATTVDILDLPKHGFHVEKITEYQFRVENTLDLYPTRRKWHNVRTGKRGTFRADHLLSLINKQLPNNK